MWQAGGRFFICDDIFAVLRRLMVTCLLPSAFAACQTTPLVYLPSSLQQKFFGACGHEGSVSFKLSRNANYLFSGFIDWDTAKGLHLNDIMGSTLALLKRSSQADIQLPNSIIRVKVDDAGRIVVGDAFTGLYLGELYCLLGGRVPLAWHQDEVTSAGRDYLLTTSDYERRIITTVGVQRFKAKLTRRIWWLFSAGELVIGSYRRQTGYLAGRGFRLHWQQQ